MQDARPTRKERTFYFEEIRRYPMLNPEEECTLAVRWRERGDRSTAHQLLTSHLRLVAKIAMGNRRYGLPTSDLISEGNVELMQAAERFNPQRGNRFSTYATWWIKAAIQNYILRSWSLVKIGTMVNQKKLFFNLAKAKRHLSALREGDLLPDHVTIIANELGVTEQDDGIHRRIAAYPREHPIHHLTRSDALREQFSAMFSNNKAQRGYHAMEGVELADWAAEDGKEFSHLHVNPGDIDASGDGSRDRDPDCRWPDQPERRTDDQVRSG
jgi:alternative sigma factor RpoH